MTGVKDQRTEVVALRCVVVDVEAAVDDLKRALCVPWAGAVASAKRDAEESLAVLVRERGRLKMILREVDR